MSRNKVKDGAPEGHSKKMPLFDGSEDDVEGHRMKVKDGAPEGHSKKMPLFDGSDDDSVEGHRK